MSYSFNVTYHYKEGLWKYAYRDIWIFAMICVLMFNGLFFLKWKKIQPAFDIVASSGSAQILHILNIYINV